MPEMQRVSSSNVAAIGYDPVMQVLHVQFNSGRTYQFGDVPQSVYENFLEAGSKGQFFNNQIKDQFAEV